MTQEETNRRSFDHTREMMRRRRHWEERRGIEAPDQGYGGLTEAAQAELERVKQEEYRMRLQEMRNMAHGLPPQSVQDSIEGRR